MNFSKTKSLQFALFLAIVFCSSFITVFAGDGATIHLLRPKQSMASGGSIYTVTVTLNGVPIEDLANGMTINYSLFSAGELNMKFQKVALGSNQGAPKTVTLKVENGGDYNYFIEATPNNLTVELADEKRMKKISAKATYDATLDLKESADKPIIK